jgi:hypothetical protein
MNSTIKTRTLGSTVLLAVLLGSAACGNDTVSETDPGNQPGAISANAPRGTSADRAEREAVEKKARQDRASTDRWARGTNHGNQPKYAGYPGRP